MIPDVKVLIAAFRFDLSHHAVARDWLVKARLERPRGSETLTLIPVVLAGFLRLATNSRVFAEPDQVEDAVGFIDAILESPGAELRSGADEWPWFRNKLLERQLAGNVVTDVWIAAAVEALSEHLVTFDRDFIRPLPKRDLTLLHLRA